jgi:hypothetical protein
MQTTDSSHGPDQAPGASARPSENPERSRDPAPHRGGQWKGGVGKSTVKVNLALQHVRGRIGPLDADLFGPSIPGQGLPDPPAVMAPQEFARNG